MRKILLAFALTLPTLAIAQAVASDKSDAMAPVHQFIDAFNKGDPKTAIAACADESSVIDDFPPYKWQGAGCGKWADGFAAISKKEGISDARIVLDKLRHVDVTDDLAYIVVTVTLIYKVKGHSKTLPSMFTASLRKEASGWRITGWAWADL